MTNRTAQEVGFTLIELIIAVAVAAIIVIVAIPSFKAMIDSTRLVTQVSAFTASLAMARSEAIQRTKQVTVCKSSDGTSCAITGSWEQGWIVFEDNNGDGDVDAGDGDELVRVGSALPAGFTLRASSNFSDSIAYGQRDGSMSHGMSIGDVNDPASLVHNGTFRICTADAVTTKSRAIEINTMGRARLVETATSCP